MIVTQFLTDDEDTNTNNNDDVLDLSFKKKTASNNEIILKQNQNLSSLLSPPSSTSSSSVMTSPKQNHAINKRLLEIPNNTRKTKQTGTISSNKRPLRFQCKHCDYKAPSTSLMQNHIYRHTDLTPYACAYCGHKSTTKSTIMVHIELCHPNMEVKINENRVREQDFYRDLNSSEITSMSNSNASPSPTPPPPPPPQPTSSSATTTATSDEPQRKKLRRSNQYDSESAPINGVAISLKNIDDDENESSTAASDDTSETENLEPINFDDDEQHTDINMFDSSPTMVKPSLTLKVTSQQIPVVDSSTSSTKEIDSEGKF